MGLLTLANPSIAQLVMQVWDEVMEETADPFRDSHLYDWLTGDHRTYRWHLDEQPRNYKGNLIPRIATVRRHIRQLGRGTKWKF